jgi:hypothetical protein
VFSPTFAIVPTVSVEGFDPVVHHPNARRVVVGRPRLVDLDATPLVPITRGVEVAGLKKKTFGLFFLPPIKGLSQDDGCRFLEAPLSEDRGEVVTRLVPAVLEDHLARFVRFPHFALLGAGDDIGVVGFDDDGEFGSDRRVANSLDEGLFEPDVLLQVIDEMLSTTALSDGQDESPLHGYLPFRLGGGGTDDSRTGIVVTTLTLPGAYWTMKLRMRLWISCERRKSISPLSARSSVARYDVERDPEDSP